MPAQSWKEKVFLAAARKNEDATLPTKPDDFEESFDYVVDKFLPEDEKDALLKVWRDNEIAHLSEELTKAANNPANMSKLVAEIGRLNAKQEAAIKTLRGKKPMAILTRGFAAVSDEEDAAIKVMQEKVRSLINANKEEFSANALHWENFLPRDSGKSNYYWGGYGRSHYSVGKLTILDVYDCICCGSRYGARHYGGKLPPTQTLKSALTAFLGGNALSSFAESHRERWNEAVEKAFSELRYYRDGRHLKELLARDWREALYLTVMGYNKRPADDMRPDDFATIIDTVLQGAPMSLLERHIFCSKLFDAMSTADIAAELFLTEKKVEAIQAKAEEALRDCKEFVCEWSTAGYAKIEAKAKANKDYENILQTAERNKTERDLAHAMYIWAFMRERKDTSPAVPSDFCETGEYIASTFPAKEQYFMRAYLLERKNIPEIAKEMNELPYRLIAMRRGIMETLRSPEKHALFMYGKAYLDSVSAEEKEAIIAPLTPIEALRPTLNATNYTALRFAKGIQTVEELLDCEIPRIRLEPRSGSDPLRQLERNLGVRSAEDVEMKEVKAKYKARMRAALIEKRRKEREQAQSQTTE